MEDKFLVQKTERFEIDNPQVEVFKEPDLPCPPDGFVWKRKIDGVLFYGAIDLGMVFFVNGKKLKKPIKEKPEDFELVDAPQ